MQQPRAAPTVSKLEPRRPSGSRRCGLKKISGAVFWIAILLAASSVWLPTSQAFDLQRTSALCLFRSKKIQETDNASTTKRLSSSRHRLGRLLPFVIRKQRPTTEQETNILAQMTDPIMDERSQSDETTGSDISSALTNETGGESQSSTKSRRRLRRMIQALSFERVSRKKKNQSKLSASTQPKDVFIVDTRRASFENANNNGGPAVSGSATTISGTTSLPSQTTFAPLSTSVMTGVTTATLDKEDESDDFLFFDAMQVGDGDNDDAFQNQEPDHDVVLLDNVIAIAPGGYINHEDGDRDAAKPVPPRDPNKEKKDKELGKLSPPPNNPAFSLRDKDPSWVDPPPPPSPPMMLPLRFLRAGKGDVAEGKRRYKATLDWRRENQIDTILRESSPHFAIIKKYYPHFCHGQGYNGEPCYYEQPPRTKLKAMQNEGVSIETVLRHYVMVTEYQWQYLIRDDLKRSIYIIDLEGMGFSDFVGDVVDFVKRASALSSQHYPERAGQGTFVQNDIVNMVR